MRVKEVEEEKGESERERTGNGTVLNSCQGYFPFLRFVLASACRAPVPFFCSRFEVQRRRWVCRWLTGSQVQGTVPLRSTPKGLACVYPCIPPCLTQKGVQS